MGKQRMNLVSFGVLIFEPVDLGGSLAIASRGFHATGVSTDLNGRRFIFPTTILRSRIVDC